ncbi:unnamed protein product [Cylindrotheca closterium]|uniref:Uncharacterized protein n=1 Tax=Cylindrotheca closterium TaxID=2856 RepID=A0AAD2CRZ3_9STRA|nr:unnamed protein product [Cylindrotheca closterium]
MSSDRQTARMKFWNSISKSKRKPSRSSSSSKTEGNNQRAEKEEEKDIIFVYKGQSKKHYPNDFTHAIIHSSVRKIGKEAFFNSESLYSIAIPPRVKTIRQSAFEECSSLVLLDLYNGLETIEYAAFRSCRSLLGTTSTGVLQQNKDSSNNDRRTIFVIPKTVTTIGGHAFFNCISLQHVQFHQGLQSIGRAAFSACRWLLEIKLPLGLKHIGNSAFCQCKSLRAVSIPPTVHAIEDGAFQYCSALGQVDLEEGLKSIESTAFASCSALSAIALPSSLEKIGFRAFLGCTSLVGVEFPSDFSAWFGEDCFAHCNSLVNVSLPASVHASCPKQVFAGCEMLPEHQALRLQERFEYFPVHRACYYASVGTVYDLILALDSHGDDPKLLKDQFGLTAFHIVATSAHPRFEMMRCLLDNYPTEILEYSDKTGRTMLDYLMMHSSSAKVIPLIQLVLQRTIVDKLSSWGVGHTWVSSLLGCLESIQSDYDIETRCKYVHDSFFGDVGHCIRLESTSLFEEALWKMRMMTVEKEEMQGRNDYRQLCRFHCGAEVVIGNVAQYLWNEDESKADTALSIFGNLVTSLNNYD